MSEQIYTDEQRLDWIENQFRTCTVYMSGQHPYSPSGTRLRNLAGPTFRAAIDKELAADGIKPETAAAGLTACELKLANGSTLAFVGDGERLHSSMHMDLGEAGCSFCYDGGCGDPLGCGETDRPKG